jgi:hypothetical protein
MRPIRHILQTNFQMNGKDSEIKPHESGAAGENYALWCEGQLIGVGDADRLSEYALYDGHAASVRHSYDLGKYDDTRYVKDEKPGKIVPEVGTLP